MKTCTTCQKELPETEFYFRKDQNRLNTICKLCFCSNRKQYCLDNPEKVKECNKRWYPKNKEKAKENQKRWILNNKDDWNAMQRKSKNKHKEKRNNQRNKQRKNRYKNDINYRLLTILRVRLNKMFRGKDKSQHSKSLLMCTLNEWKIHLESLFLPGMSWDNHGYGIGNMACRWQNTQPMWHIDNMKKLNKILKEVK